MKIRLKNFQISSMITPNISWKENEVLITYQDTKLSYHYSSLLDSDLNIPGLDLDEFKQMVESIRYNPKHFVKNFKNRNDDPPGFQRCRALNLARIYPNRFNIVSQSFCSLAYRYLYDNMGSIKELENMYKELRCFKEIEDPCAGEFNYRWSTSIWTALAHCYVKEGNGSTALELFNKVHSFAHITLWPSAMVNILGACYVTDQSVEYAEELYKAAIRHHEIENIYGISEIIHASKILEVIMGKDNRGIPLLYLEANDLLKNHI